MSEKNLRWKKTMAIMIAAAMVLMCGCGEGKVKDVKILNVASEIYSYEDIEAACYAVKYYFRDNFEGCTLKILYYPGDAYADFNEWAEQYEADEAIVLVSSFDVGAFGGDGSLNSNSTYDDFMWILVRNNGGKWDIVDKGY